VILNPEALIHFIDEETGIILLKKISLFIPSLGSGVRLGGLGDGKFYRIERIIWNYDEPDCPFTRVNIGVKEA